MNTINLKLIPGTTTVLNMETYTGSEFDISASVPSGLSAVATTGNYDDLTNKPNVIPINDAPLIFKDADNNEINRFTANSNSDVVVSLPIHTIRIWQ